MAIKRMFSMRVLDDERFLSLPLAAQALYCALCMRADDDGFLDTAQRLLRYVGAEEGDLRVLFERGFLLDMGGGVTVIRHWRVHNTIRQDRYTPTIFQAEFARLTIREDGAYELAEAVSPNRLPSGCQAVAIDIEERRKALSQERGCGGEGTSAAAERPVGKASGREGCFLSADEARAFAQNAVTAVSGNIPAGHTAVRETSVPASGASGITAFSPPFRACTARSFPEN